AMTLAFSAIVAFISMTLNLRHPGLIITLVGFYGLLFGIHKARNSGWGLVLTFALTGFMGYTLGPLLNFYLSLNNGAQLVTMALGMTALVFFGLSAYAIMTRKDFSFLSGFILAGFVVLLCAVVASFFVQMSGLQLAISAGFVLFSSAVILYQTSAIIHGGEDNYILATVTLFVSIYNLFLSLLQLLGVFSSDCVSECRYNAEARQLAALLVLGSVQSMDFAIPLLAGPQDPAARSALDFSRAVLAAGHRISRLFFYRDGVLVASQLNVVPQDEKDIGAEWRQFIQDNHLDAVVCIAAAL